MLLLGFCLFRSKMADLAQKVYERKSVAPAQQADNERKEFLAGTTGDLFFLFSVRCLPVARSRVRLSGYGSCVGVHNIALRHSVAGKGRRSAQITTAISPEQPVTRVACLRSPLGRGFAAAAR